MESIIKLLIIVELDRAEQQRKYISQSISDGIRASAKKNGRPKGHLDKMNDSLKNDIKAYVSDRSITQSMLLQTQHISRNTLKKYIEIVKNEPN